MFTLKMDDPRILINSISILSEFITEATFNITKEGLKLVAMDPSNISMVILDILPSTFTTYSVSDSEEITLNLEGLKQALRRVRGGETVSLTTEKNKFLITITGKSTRKFYIPLLEKEGGEKQVPSLEFTASAELDAKEFKEFIEDAGVVGDAVIFEATPDKFALSSGEVGSKVNIELTKGSDALIKIEVKEPVKAIYSVEYLKKMSKASALADTVALQFSSDYPLRLDFKSINKLQMSFILAPRIENK